MPTNAAFIATGNNVAIEGDLTSRVIVVTIDPGYGAVAFAAVVILTMFAAEAFDPRLMWDSAARSQRRAA